MGRGKAGYRDRQAAYPPRDARAFNSTSLVDIAGQHITISQRQQHKLNTIVRSQPRNQPAARVLSQRDNGDLLFSVPAYMEDGNVAGPRGGFITSSGKLFWM